MFIDYNLFGMNFVVVDAVKFRHPPPGVTIATSSSSISGVVMSLGALYCYVSVVTAEIYICQGCFTFMQIFALNSLRETIHTDTVQWSHRKRFVAAICVLFCASFT